MDELSVGQSIRDSLEKFEYAEIVQIGINRYGCRLVDGNIVGVNESTKSVEDAVAGAFMNYYENMGIDIYRVLQDLKNDFAKYVRVSISTSMIRLLFTLPKTRDNRAKMKAQIEASLAKHGIAIKHLDRNERGKLFSKSKIVSYSVMIKKLGV